MLVIIGLVVLWYGLVPMTGALLKRYNWFKFRRHFNRLRMHRVIDRHTYWRMGTGECGDSPESTGVFRFTGEFESITETKTLWVRSEDLAVPVSLKNAETYLLPMQTDEDKPGISDPSDETPEKIRWEKIRAMGEGTKVFVGGRLAHEDGRWGFVSTKENPLTVIFYDGPDHSLARRAIWAGRHGGEYFNFVTPYSLIIGALCLLLVAVSFLPRPAFHLTVAVSLVAIFVPLFPLMPPGLLFTTIYRRLTWRSRILRAYSDLAKLPLHYFPPGTGEAANRQEPLRGKRVLPDGEMYGFAYRAELPAEVYSGKIPMLIPEITTLEKGKSWYIFGAVRPSEILPFRPRDPFATFGVLPGNPKKIARRYTVSAYLLETLAWLMLLSALALNIFFLTRVLPLLF